MTKYFMLTIHYEIFYMNLYAYALNKSISRKNFMSFYNDAEDTCLYYICTDISSSHCSKVTRLVAFICLSFLQVNSYLHHHKSFWWECGLGVDMGVHVVVMPHLFFLFVHPGSVFLICVIVHDNVV